MAHDLVIRGGTIVDGTGRAPFVGDIAVDGGVITQVGGVAGPAEQVIDAQGLTVTPGFVDIHTHLDAQIAWDPLLTPVSWHGVTTVLMGNCGVTFAPCKRQDRETLAAMMETVEDIPRTAIMSDLPWTWESYGEYLDSIEKMRPAINVAGMVGHCAVRYYVMGERSVEELASEDEKRQIAEIVAKSIDDGAVGFSSNRFPEHVMPDGRPIPGTFADHDEVMQVAHKVSQRGAVMQNVLDFRREDLGNVELVRRQASEAGARVLFSYSIGAHDGAGARAKRFMDGLCADGGDITAATVPRGTGFLFGLQSRIPAYDLWAEKFFFGPSWEALAGKDLAGRLAAIRDPAIHAALVAEAKAADPERMQWIESVYWLGSEASPDYLSHVDDHLAAMADAAGEHWSETFLRLSDKSHGTGLFTWRILSKNQPELKDWLADERVLPGLSDAGAHVSQVMDSGVSSFFLYHWIKAEGLCSLAEGVRRLTSAPARVIGLKDRGALQVGLRADINVVDFDEVGEDYPKLVHDFPGGAARFIQRSSGYVATLVNGEVTFKDGQHTGARAGKVLRHQATGGVTA